MPYESDSSRANPRLTIALDNSYVAPVRPARRPRARAGPQGGRAYRLNDRELPSWSCEFNSCC